MIIRVGVIFRVERTAVLASAQFVVVLVIFGVKWAQVKRMLAQFSIGAIATAEARVAHGCAHRDSAIVAHAYDILVAKVVEAASESGCISPTRTEFRLYIVVETMGEAANPIRVSIVLGIMQASVFIIKYVVAVKVLFIYGRFNRPYCERDWVKLKVGGSIVRVGTQQNNTVGKMQKYSRFLTKCRRPVLC